MVFTAQLSASTFSELRELLELHVQSHWSTHGWYSVRQDGFFFQYECGNTACNGLCKSNCCGENAACWRHVVRERLANAAACGGVLLLWDSGRTPDVLAYEADVAAEVGCRTLVLNLDGSVWEELTDVLALANEPDAVSGWLELMSGASRSQAFKAAKALRELCHHSDTRRRLGRNPEFLQLLLGWLRSTRARQQELAAGLIQNLCNEEPSVKLHCARADFLQALAAMLLHGKPAARGRAAGALANILSGTRDGSLLRRTLTPSGTAGGARHSSACTPQPRVVWERHRELCEHMKIKLDVAAIPGVVIALVGLLRSDIHGACLSASFALANLCNACPPNQALIIGIDGAVERLGWLTVSSCASQREAAASALWGLCSSTPEHCPSVTAAPGAVVRLVAMLGDADMPPRARATAAGAVWALVANNGANEALARRIALEAGALPKLESLLTMFSDAGGPSADAVELVSGALSSLQTTA